MQFNAPRAVAPAAEPVKNEPKPKAPATFKRPKLVAVAKKQARNDTTKSSPKVQVKPMKKKKGVPRQVVAVAEAAEAAPPVEKDSHTFHLKAVTASSVPSLQSLGLSKPIPAAKSLIGTLMFHFLFLRSGVVVN